MLMFTLFIKGNDLILITKPQFGLNKSLDITSVFLAS